MTDAAHIDPDKHFGEETVTDSMAAIGGMLLRDYGADLGPTQAMVAARRIFCAMRAEEARQREPARSFVMPEAGNRVLDIAGSLATVARSAARGTIAAANPKLMASIFLATPLLGGELEKPVECASAPSPVTELGELVRIHFGFDDRIAAHDELAHLLALEIEPFIIGVGKVEVRLTREGLVIRKGGPL